jgi:hypothetical protein
LADAVLRFSHRRALENQLVRLERLGHAFGRAASDAAQPGQRQERVVREPAASVLAGEALADDRHLLRDLSLQQRNEEVGICEIAFVFRDLVFEDEVVAEGVVGELGYEPVVLVRVILSMGQDQRGAELPLQRFEDILDVRTLERELAVAEAEGVDGAPGDLAKKGGRGLPGLCRSPFIAAEHDPADAQVGQLLHQAQDRAAAPDLDVIGMRAEAE